MRGAFSSYRRRRRIVRGAALLLAAAVALAVGLRWTNTAPSLGTPLSKVPAVIVQNPDPVVPTAGERQAVRAAAAAFLTSAVRGDDLLASWSLVTPGLQQGMSRAEWSRGNIPVTPYPVQSARWKLDYAYADRIGLQVYLTPKPTSRLRPAVFAIELKQLGPSRSRRWLVDSWVPRAASPLSAGGGPEDLFAAGPREGVKAPLGLLWLLVPGGLLGLGLLVPVAFLGWHWYRGNRAYRAYSSSSKPS